MAGADAGEGCAAGSRAGTDAAGAAEAKNGARAARGEGGVVAGAGVRVAVAASEGSRCSMPLNISLHDPQRTRPERNFNWSCATRKVV